MIDINSKTYDPEQGVWYVSYTLELPNGGRMGTETLSLPEEATEAELGAAILKAYA